MKVSLITPTINVPLFLIDYEANVRKYGHENVDYIIVGDKKSPAGTAEFCKTISNCTYLDVDKQIDYMKRFPDLAAHIPFNCPERLNVGMLWAYEHGTDLFVMVNDDNFPSDCDMIALHKIAGESPALKTIGSSSDWYNVCDSLEEENGVKFYHRGYPLKQRWNDGKLTITSGARKIVVNEGLWLDNPDTDVITRLERPLYVKSFCEHRTFALAPGTWSPLNSQNTTIIREAVPAYFQSPHIGRHSDIWAGYVIDRLAEHFNHAISFGHPLSIHKRSPHDLWKDLELEKRGMQMTDDFCDALRKVKIASHTYHGGLADIINKLDALGIGSVISGMALWHKTFERLV